MVLSICEDPKILEIIRLINIFINIIRIIVPLVLIFVLMFKFLGAITKNDNDGLQKVLKIVPKNLIAAAVIFLIPTVVRITVRITSSNNDYDKCLRVVSTDEINRLYENKIEDLISQAERTENISDYNNASNYLKNIKNTKKREIYEERLAILKGKIDDEHRVVESESTGLGSNITPSKELIEACRWVLNADDINIRLYTCTNPTYQYKNPQEALPGGATAIMVKGLPTFLAKKTIPYSQYQYGLFGGEIDFRFNAEFNKIFAIMYRQVILHSIARREANGRNMKDASGNYRYEAGSCTQNYKQNVIDNRMNNPEKKAIIEDAVLSTKYLLLANASDGSLTEIRYNTHSGILGVMDKASKEGDYQHILQAMKSGHTQSNYYKDAEIYDCRNLLDDSSSNDNKTIDRSIIYMGDSRTVPYKNIIKEQSISEEKEKVIATSGTFLRDKNYNAHMSEVKALLNRSDKSYAVTVNYGINGITSGKDYVYFCEDYKKLVKSSFTNKDQFYFVSVNPVIESKTKYDIKNSRVELFNDYMKNTCMVEMKKENPNVGIYYCDIYGSLSIDDWIKKGYIMDDGVHYTGSGNKYIYDKIKKCIISYQ